MTFKQVLKIAFCPVLLCCSSAMAQRNAAPQSIDGLELVNGLQEAGVRTSGWQ